MNNSHENSSFQTSRAIRCWSPLNYFKASEMEKMAH